MLILPGVELNYEPLSQHVGKVTGDRETLYVLNHPARYALTVDETLYRIRVIREAGLPIEAMEITDTGVYRPEYDVEALALPKIATDDSHRDPDFGRAWIEVEAATKTADAILRAVKAGDFRVGFATTKRAPRRPQLPRVRLQALTPMLRNSIGVRAGTARVSRSGSPPWSHWITTSLTAPSQARVATRVSSGGIASSDTA